MKAMKKESVGLDEISVSKLNKYRAANEKDRERLSREIGFIKGEPTETQKKLIAKLQSRNTADMLAFKKDAPYLFKSMGKQAAKVDAPDAYDDPRMHKSYLKYKNQKESYDLDEAKMSNAEVLAAAKKLASNAKDAKTKEFGKGLVDFYAKNKSFTPAQVGGLQNIMKNAGFQLAKESYELEEAKKDKPSFGSSDGFSYAVNLNGVDNEFLNQPFGRQLDAMKKVKEFTSKAKKGYAGAKGKSTLAAVKDWVKLNQPTQFYAKWKSDSSSYKNDSVEIFYTKEANESLDEVSSKTLANYINKASDASKHRKLPAKKVDNRYAGVNLASKKLDKQLSGVKESDDLDEAMLDRKKIAKAVKARYDFKSGMDYQQIVPKINQELVRAGMKIFVGDRDVINSILDLID